MSTTYPSQIDTSITLPNVIDLVTPVAAASVNQLRDAILAIENAIGTSPAGMYSTLRARLDAIDTTAGAAVTIGGDIGGTFGSPKVIGIQGYPVSSNPPIQGEFLAWDGYQYTPTTNILSANITAANADIGSASVALMNIHGKAVFDGIMTALPSGAGQGIMYYDTTTNKFKISENGGAYINLLPTLTGTNKQVVFNDNGSFGTNVGFTYDKASGKLGTSTVSSIPNSSSLTFETTAFGNFAFLDTNTVRMFLTSTDLTIGVSKTIENGNSNLTIINETASVQTTNATTTNLYTWSIPFGTTTVNVEIQGLKSDYTAAASFKRSITFRNNSGTVTIVGSSTPDDGGTRRDDANWAVVLDNSTTTGRVRVTGVASTNITWTCQIRRAEMIP